MDMDVFQRSFEICRNNKGTVGANARVVPMRMQCKGELEYKTVNYVS